MTTTNPADDDCTTAIVIISVFLFAGYFALVDGLLESGERSLLSLFVK